MKTLLLLLALVPLSSFADSELDKYLREGDEVEFVKQVVFANPSKYENQTVIIYGKVIKEAGFSLPTRCYLSLNTPANSKMTIRVGRVMKYSSDGELESGVSIGCQYRSENEAGEEEWTSSFISAAEVGRSLTMLKIKRKAPPPPSDGDL